MSTLILRALAPDEREEWRKLYSGYTTFYKRELTDKIADTVWDWLHNPGHELEGVVAVQDGKLVGLAHFRRMPSPARGADIGFLDDLFVDPDIRGQGVAPALLRHVKQVAKERNWEIVRWLTADNNYRARSLYDQHATKAIWNVYEMKSE